METKHICPKCGQASGWHGPPFEGRFGKLRAILFHIRRQTLFSKDSNNYPFVRCLNCGYVVTSGEYKQLKQIPRETLPTGKDSPYAHPLYVPKIGRNATKQDISRFMKHGRQAPWYRKSIKAKVKPEEDD